MKIVFNPYYDRGVWTPDPGKGSCTTGCKYSGPKGLIDELALRMGIACLEKSDYEIFCAWYSSVKESVDRVDSCFKKSFDLEPLAVSQKLLDWRNALVMYGWNPDTTLPEGLSANARMIMDELSQAESVFYQKGYRTFSNKVRMVMEQIPRFGAVPANFEVNIPATSLEPIWQRLFKLLEQAGCQVQFPENSSKLPERISVIRFKNHIDACMWAALSPGNDLIICNNPAPLDWALRSLGKPTTESSSSASNHQMPHLFVDILQLCCPKYDLNSVISYLSVSPHPLDQFKNRDGKASLRWELQRHIRKQGGFGYNQITKTSLREIMEKYVTEEKGMDEIEFWLPFLNTRSEISCNEVIKKISALAIWAKKSNTEWLGQLAQTCEAFTGMLDLLGYSGKYIESDELKKLCDYIYRPQSSLLHNAETGSMSVTTSIDAIASKVGSAVWLDPMPSEASYPFAFLADSDVALLQNVIDIPTRSALLLQSMESNQASLSNVSSLTLVYCDKIGCETPTKHRILVEALSGKKDIPYARLEKAYLKDEKLSSPRTQKMEHNLDKDFFKGMFKESISPSAMDLLLERPFDYAIKYLMNLWDDGSSHETTVKGNVSHYIIESIYDKAKGENGICTPECFEEIFTKEYDQIFENAVRQCGMLLNQPENALTLKYLKLQLQKHAIPSFVKLLKNNKFNIVGSELPISGVIGCNGHNTDIGIDARIDLLLKNQNGDYVIIDLKYQSNSSRDKRKEQVKKGTDYQLLLYRAVIDKMVIEGRLPKGNVLAAGFFMLATSEVLSTYPFKGFDAVEAKIGYEEALGNLFTRYEEMMENLHNGILTEGENMKYLCPDSKGNMKEKKIPDNSYGENKILKGKLN